MPTRKLRTCEKCGSTKVTIHRTEADGWNRGQDSFYECADCGGKLPGLPPLPPLPPLRDLESDRSHQQRNDPAGDPSSSSSPLD